jgi:hypothetical protein
MAIDTRRVILAAVEAALDDVMSAAPKPGKKNKKDKKDKTKRGLPTGRAVLLGAGAVTAVRMAASPRARELAGSVQERLADYVEDGAGD